MTLTEKIELLIKRTQMSASQFADVINIPRSSISHIVSGRNKPSLDVVQKILKSFPEISAEELLYEDRNLLYIPNSFVEQKKVPNTPSSNNKPTSQVSLGGLFDQPIDNPRESDEKKSSEIDLVQATLKPIEKTEKLASSTKESTIEISSGVNQIYSNHTEKYIERVIIFYSDGTFSESKPSR